MNFRTAVDIKPAPWQIGYKDKIALLGSCFSDNIARKMSEFYFQVTCNPTGTLYNPVSIAHHIDDVAPKADVVIITFGTAWVYVDKATNEVVDNCQKRPATDFIRRRLSIEEIVALWQPIIARYADKRFIFTVSPIRHIKDGLHENNLSKAILHLAVEQLIQSDTSASQRPIYFPAYDAFVKLLDFLFLFFCQSTMRLQVFETRGQFALPFLGNGLLSLLSKKIIKNPHYSHNGCI